MRCIAVAVAQNHLGLRGSLTGIFSMTSFILANVDIRVSSWLRISVYIALVCMAAGL